ncbi:hypothetical protein [Pelagicoccus enzymogenes]|nr:hypothetical protein [Pelagicoccus enzymogenes]
MKKKTNRNAPAASSSPPFPLRMLYYLLELLDERARCRECPPLEDPFQK